MTENEIHELLDKLDFADKETALIAGKTLLASFLANQARIAAALETLAECVKRPNSYATSEFEINLYGDHRQ